jgi:outer membrane lipoprotein carrier protein
MTRAGSAARFLGLERPEGPQESSPGREPGVGPPSPRLRRPSPAPAGEGRGVRGHANPGLTPWANAISPLRGLTAGPRRHVWLRHGRAALPLSCRLSLVSYLFVLLFPLSAMSGSLPPVSVGQYVEQFEASYRRVTTLKADFTQKDFAWGRTRVESGTVYIARGGRMRWVYSQPEKKIFLTDGKHVLLYLPAEKQLRISSLRDVEDSPVPLDLLLSHIQLGKFFSHFELAPQALEASPGDQVIRGYPHGRLRGDITSALIEVTPSFDIRKLVLFKTDNSTMQFTFSNIRRNAPLDLSMFVLIPPPGTEVVRQ